jgi:predicted phosphoadenosine phosphosulfate sulfurtransferase
MAHYEAQMTDLIVLPQTNQWQKLKALVLDSVSSPITKRVYNLGLDEFFEWYGRGTGRRTGRGAPARLLGVPGAAHGDLSGSAGRSYQYIRLGWEALRHASF